MSTYSLAIMQNIDRLIQIKGTGSPGALARRMNVSERTIYKYLSLLKDLGAPIEYDIQRQTYYYSKQGSFHFQYKQEIEFKK